MAFLAAGLAVIGSPASADVLTLGNKLTGDTIDPFGAAPNSTPTYGQLFASPRAGELTFFTFNMTGSLGQIRAAVGAWNGTANFITGGGSPRTLWQSDLVASDPGVITFRPNIQIAGLTRYVACITVYGSPDAAGSTFMLLGNNTYEAALR